LIVVSLLAINKSYIARIKLQDIAEFGLTKSTSKRKRNKLIVAILAPILIICHIAGWSLYWLNRISGRQKPNQQQKLTNKTPTRQNEDVSIIIPHQDKEIKTN
jgi:hypothetical protein